MMTSPPQQPLWSPPHQPPASKTPHLVPPAPEPFSMTWRSRSKVPQAPWNAQTCRSFQAMATCRRGQAPGRGSQLLQNRKSFPREGCASPGTSPRTRKALTSQSSPKRLRRVRTRAFTPAIFPIRDYFPSPFSPFLSAAAGVGLRSVERIAVPVLSQTRSWNSHSTVQSSVCSF